MVFNIATTTPGILSMQEEEGRGGSSQACPFYQEIWSLLAAKEGGNNIMNIILK